MSTFYLLVFTAVCIAIAIFALGAFIADWRKHRRETRWTRERGE